MVAAPHPAGWAVLVVMVMAVTADPTPRLEPSRGGLPRPAARGGTGEEMPDLRRSTDGDIRLRGEVPLGSSQPRGREDVASGENRARLRSWRMMVASQTSFPSGGIVVVGFINLIGKFQGKP